MKILNAYVLKQLIVGFVVVLLGMTTLVWLTQSLRMLDMIVTKGVSVGIFLKMTLLVLPNFIQILSPLSLFAVVLFVFSRMQSDKELMVMQAVGMSRRQIMAAPLMLAVVLAGVGYFLTLVLIPQSNTDLRELKWKVRNDLSHLLLQEGQFNSFKNGLTLYVRERAKDGTVRGVIAYDAKDPKKVATLIAQKGTIFQEDTGIQVVFQEGTRQEFNPETRQFSVLKFDRYTMWFSDQDNTGERRSDIREYDMRQLLSATPADTPNMSHYRKYKVEALKRLVQPLYNFTFVFLAVFGVLSGHYNRRGQIGRINAAVVAALMVQSLALAFENMAGKNLWFMPMMVLNAVVPIGLVYVLMTGRRLGMFFKKLIPIVVTCLISVSALAVPRPDFDGFNQNKPVDFEADTIAYDAQNDVVTATGNVIVTQNKTVLKTPRILFDRRKNQIFAPDQVTLISPDGTVTQSAQMTLSADMTALVGKMIEMRLADGTTIKAENVERKERGTILDLNNLRYTPCDVCEGKDPLWQLRAKQMRHDAPDQAYVFKHSFFDVSGVPVFYFPYLSMPDHTVKRKTGFLAPGLSHGSTMKGGITLPFFIDVAPNQNLTVSPTLSVTHDPLIQMDYQGLFSKAGLKMALSGTRDDDGSQQGHIRAAGVYDLTSDWRLSGELFKVSSDTYFRRYDIEGIDDSDSFLTSHAMAEYFGERVYFNARGLSFQSLEDGVSSDSIPTILPVFNYYRTSLPLTAGGLTAFSHINAALINTKEHFKSNRLSVTQGFQMPYVSGFGATVDMVGTIRADGYSIDSGRNGFTGVKADDSYVTGRFFPSFSATVSYPLSRVSDTGVMQILEPVVMGVVAPNGSNDKKIPNMDSLIYDFDDTNLFSRNRFAGYDRVESGTRLNYGIKWALYDRENRSVSTLFGQSYRFRKDDDLGALMGYNANFSDYVGRIKMNYGPVSLAYHFRLDQDNLTPNKHEVEAWAGTAPLRVGIEYVYLKSEQMGDTFYPSREEIVLHGASKFSQNWTLAGSYRYNLGKTGGPVSFDVTARYDNECLGILFDVSRSYTRDRDYKGDTSFMVKFILKTLGGME